MQNTVTLNNDDIKKAIAVYIAQTYHFNVPPNMIYLTIRESETGSAVWKDGQVRATLDLSVDS